MHSKKSLTSNEKEILNKIKQSPELKKKYEDLNEEFQAKFLEFCMGARGLPITYDPFFKRIFDPEVNPWRLSRLLSLILGETVMVHRVLLNEGSRIVEAGTLLIMDIVVELLDGSIANVEIQKVAYFFPGERAACYSSDLVMRQYSRVRKEKGKKFSYRDLKKVYTIVFMEQSSIEFQKCSKFYIHKSRQIFDTGLELDLLQEFVFISLDNFKRIKQNEVIEELDAWMHCIASEEPEIIQSIIERYPDFEEIYADINTFRRDIGGVLDMFSEALKILDRNTVQYMIDDLQAQVKAKDKEIQVLLAEKDTRLAEKENRIQELEAQLKKMQK